jgi:hypothetical protein
MKFSYTKLSTYEECGLKYKYHYIDRLRPTGNKSYFIFGTAIDNGVEALLKGEDYQEAVSDALKNFRSLPDVQFSKSDLDISILTKNDQIDYYNEVKFHGWSEDVAKLELGILVLKEKARLMMEALKQWVIDNVEEFHEAQVEIILKNQEGDELIGFCDLILTLKDGKKYVIDIKTSSNPKKYYPEDTCLENSSQLHIYAEYLKIDNIGYVVVDKNIRKNNPRVRIHTVFGKRIDSQADVIFDKVDASVRGIKQQNYVANKNSCDNYGGCPYKKYCNSNGKVLDGLEFKEDV